MSRGSTESYAEAQASKIFVALLGKQFGVIPRGWREAAGAYGEKVLRGTCMRAVRVARWTAELDLRPRRLHPATGPAEGRGS